jgi:hypothetical protein
MFFQSDFNREGDKKEGGGAGNKKGRERQVYFG